MDNSATFIFDDLVLKDNIQLEVMYCEGESYLTLALPIPSGRSHSVGYSGTGADYKRGLTIVLPWIENWRWDTVPPTVIFMQMY